MNALPSVSSDTTTSEKWRSRVSFALEVGLVSQRGGGSLRRVEPESSTTSNGCVEMSNASRRAHANMADERMADSVSTRTPAAVLPRSQSRSCP